MNYCGLGKEGIGILNYYIDLKNYIGDCLEVCNFTVLSGNFNLLKAIKIFFSITLNKEFRVILVKIYALIVTLGHYFFIYIIFPFAYFSDM